MNIIRYIILIAFCCTFLKAEGLQEHDKNSPAYDTGLGNVAYNDKQYEKAIKFYLAALKKDPKYTRAEFCLALVYQELNKFEDAKIHYQKVIEVDPAHPDALCNLGYISYKEKNYRQAVIYFNDAASVSIGDKNDAADFYYNEGTSYEKLLEWNKAKNAYEKALEKNERHFRAHYNLGTLYLQKIYNLSKAKKHLLRANLLEPKEIDPLLNIAILAGQINIDEKPIFYLSKAVRLAPPESNILAKALWKRASFYFENNQKSNMKADLEALLKINPNFPGANGRLGIYLESLGDYDNAIVYMEKEVEGKAFDPKNPIDLDCHYVLAMLYKEKKINPTKALDHARIYNENKKSLSIESIIKDMNKQTGDSDE